MQNKNIPLPKKIQDHPNPSVQKLNLSIFVGQSNHPQVPHRTFPLSARKKRHLTSMRIGKLPSSLEPARLKIQGLGGKLFRREIPGTLKLTFSLPENGWLEYDRLLLGCRMAYFHGFAVGFREL